MIIHANKENLSEILQNNKLVILDFFATWCIPCKMLSSVFEEISNENEYNGKVVFCKIDIDENLDLTEKYSIMSVPTLLFIKNGNVVNQEIGSRSKKELEDIIGKLI